MRGEGIEIGGNIGSLMLMFPRKCSEQTDGGERVDFGLDNVLLISGDNQCFCEGIVTVVSLTLTNLSNSSLYQNFFPVNCQEESFSILLVIFVPLIVTNGLCGWRPLRMDVCWSNPIIRPNQNESR
ncbi:hypothetical protein OROGR_012810 [Orobanche gracilis]